MPETTLTCPKCDAAFVLQYPAHAPPASHKCSACGADIPVLLAAPPPPVPPILGTPAPPASSTPTGLPKNSNMAVASMVLGILGVIGGWICCGPIFPVLAIVFGHVSYSRICRKPAELTGKGFAIAGFTMGYVGLMLGLIALCILATNAAIMAAIAQEMTKQFPNWPKP